MMGFATNIAFYWTVDFKKAQTVAQKGENINVNFLLKNHYFLSEKIINQNFMILLKMI